MIINFDWNRWVLLALFLCVGCYSYSDAMVALPNFMKISVSVYDPSLFFIKFLFFPIAILFLSVISSSAFLSLSMKILVIIILFPLRKVLAYWIYSIRSARFDIHENKNPAPSWDTGKKLPYYQWNFYIQSIREKYSTTLEVDSITVNRKKVPTNFYMA